MVEKEFIRYKDVHEKLTEVLMDFQELAKQYIEDTTKAIVNDFDKYVHGDTNIPGCLRDIRVNWNIEHGDYMSFDNIIKHIDSYYNHINNGTKLTPEQKTDYESHLKLFQDYAFDWFFSTFGTYGLKYNFISFIE